MLFVAGATLYTSEPGASSADAKVLSFYADHDNQLKIEIAYVLITAAAVLFIWFASSLASSLRMVEGGSGWLSGVVLVSGAAFSVVLVLGFTFGVMVPNTSDHVDRYQVDPRTAALLNDVIYPLAFETALPLVAPLVFAASLVFLRTRLLPRWFAWAGFVVAAGCLLGVLGVTMMLFLIWSVVASVYLIRAGRPRTPPT